MEKCKKNKATIKIGSKVIDGYGCALLDGNSCCVHFYTEDEVEWYDLLDCKENSSWYEILNVKPNATDKEIKKAFKVKVLEIHPDKNKKNFTIAMQKLNEARKWGLL